MTNIGIILATYFNQYYRAATLRHLTGMTSIYTLPSKVLFCILLKSDKMSIYIHMLHILLETMMKCIACACLLTADGHQHSSPKSSHSIHPALSQPLHVSLHSGLFQLPGGILQPLLWFAAGVYRRKDIVDHLNFLLFLFLCLLFSFEWSILFDRNLNFFGYHFTTKSKNLTILDGILLWK